MSVIGGRPSGSRCVTQKRPDEFFSRSDPRMEWVRKSPWPGPASTLRHSPGAWTVQARPPSVSGVPGPVASTRQR